jgi:hypothetical protein
MNDAVLAMLARERQSRLLAQAQASRWARQERLTTATRAPRRGAAARHARGAFAIPRRPAGTGLVRAMLAADRRALDAELAEQAAFNSPIRRYTTRAEVLHLLALIGPILPDARIERSWQGKHGAATVISATLDRARLDGIVEELHGRDGRVHEVTLMLRPHSAMMPAISHMAAALERHPLPT